MTFFGLPVHCLRNTTHKSVIDFATCHHLLLIKVDWCLKFWLFLSLIIFLLIKENFIAKKLLEMVSEDIFQLFTGEHRYLKLMKPKKWSMLAKSKCNKLIEALWELETKKKCCLMSFEEKKNLFHWISFSFQKRYS